MAGFATKSAADYYSDGFREEALWEWVNSSGEGMMGMEFGEVPDECMDFVLSQYARFNVPHGPELFEAIKIGAASAFYFVEIGRPYALFEGVSDVDLTDDWATTTYKIFDPTGPDKRSYEANPNELETYSFRPGQAEEMWRKLMGTPGIDALPYLHGEDLRDLLADRDLGELLTDKGEAALRAVCPDGQRMRSFLELGAWAAYIWLIGPDSRGFRMYRHEVMGVAISEGECLIAEGQIISSNYYTKIDRPPQSCYHCGVQTWCVEHTLSGHHHGFICEACLNFDMPKSKAANCGTRFCAFGPCPNHPLHHLGRQASFQARNENGYLRQLAAGSKARLAADTPKRLGF